MHKVTKAVFPVAGLGTRFLPATKAMPKELFPKDADYDGIVLAVEHDRFHAMGASGMRRFGRTDHVLYDLKNLHVR